MNLGFIGLDSELDGGLKQHIRLEAIERGMERVFDDDELREEVYDKFLLANPGTEESSESDAFYAFVGDWVEQKIQEED